MPHALCMQGVQILTNFPDLAGVAGDGRDLVDAGRGASCHDVLAQKFRKDRQSSGKISEGGMNCHLLGSFYLRLSRSLPTLFPISPPAAAPATVPKVEPPVTTAPTTPPTTAPDTVPISCLDGLLWQPASVQIMRIGPNDFHEAFIDNTREWKVKQVSGEAAEK